MNKHPLISIIVPVYNTALYLDRCIDSLIGQIYSNIEIILVNDGSTDESGMICDRYSNVDHRVMVIHQENSGPMAACRKGIGVSKGDYFCFMDSDDRIDAVMISEMIKQLRGNLPEMICCNIIVERAHRTSKEEHGLAAGEYEGDRHREIFQTILGNEKRQIILSRCMKIFSRDLIVSNLNACDDHLRMGEDSVMTLLALFDSKRIVIMANAYYYHYYYNSESLVHGYMPDLYHQICRLNAVTQRLMTEKVKQHGLFISEEEIKAQCQREHLFRLMNALKNEARGNREYRAYRRNVKDICRNEKTYEMTRQYPLAVSGLANRLIYLVLKYPCCLTMGILRMAANVFYSRLV